MELENIAIAVSKLEDRVENLHTSLNKVDTKLNNGLAERMTIVEMDIKYIKEKLDTGSTRNWDTIKLIFGIFAGVIVGIVVSLVKDLL